MPFLIQCPFPSVTRRKEAFPKPPPPKSTAFVKIAEPLVKRMDVNWVAVLVHCEDGKDFEIVGNAFQVKGVLANVDDLKKAIDPSLSPFQSSNIDIYSQKEEGWVREDEEAAVNRGKSKPSTRIRCLSALGCAVAQLSGQTATDSCYQPELLEPHSLRLLLAVVTCYSRLRQCWGTTFHLVQ
ncbi:unnamed protein product [Effrenium voratum]|nr:unnamed protein product [Effrenium voratum]